MKLEKRFQIYSLSQQFRFPIFCYWVSCVADKFEFELCVFLWQSIWMDLCYSWTLTCCLCRYEDMDIALHYGPMLRECIRHQCIARYLSVAWCLWPYFSDVQKIRHLKVISREVSLMHIEMVLTYYAIIKWILRWIGRA